MITTKKTSKNLKPLIVALYIVETATTAGLKASSVNVAVLINFHSDFAGLIASQANVASLIASQGNVAGLIASHANVAGLITIHTKAPI